MVKNGERGGAVSFFCLVIYRVGWNGSVVFDCLLVLGSGFPSSVFFGMGSWARASMAFMCGLFALRRSWSSRAGMSVCLPVRCGSMRCGAAFAF